jgi:hypothetical protein
MIIEMGGKSLPTDVCLELSPALIRDFFFVSGSALLGNPHAILAAIADKRKLEPSGEPSLQNGLDMARSSMK